MQPFSPQAAARELERPDEQLLARCEETFFVASGPGGQNRNKRETGVRLVHRPSGVMVTATERRSQGQNRAIALERLRARLAQLAVVPEPRRPTGVPRASRRRRLEDKRRLAEKKQHRLKVR